MQDPLAGTSYRTVRLLGRGGMGEVYEAEHLGLGRRVAVKLVSAADESAEAIDRFRLEAQALAHVEHPGVVAIHDIASTPEGRTYVVMELLRGRSLHALWREAGAVPLPEVVRIGRAVLGALQAAHDAGLVHRDVKPGNVFVCDDGTVKLLDFGVAKVVGPGARVAPLAKPTADGVPVGTPNYFAPEQALGRKIDGRADVYGVGALLWSLAVGQRIFGDRKELVDLFQAHISEVPPAPSTRAPQPLPPAFDRIVLTALAKRPDDRFPSAQAMSRALAVLEDELTQPKTLLQRGEQAAEAPGPPVPATWAVARSVLAGVALALLAMGLVEACSMALTRAPPRGGRVEPSLGGER